MFIPANNATTLAEKKVENSILDLTLVLLRSDKTNKSFSLFY